MNFRRSVAAPRGVALGSLLSAAAVLACSAPPGADGDPAFDAPEFSGAPAGAGGSANTSPPTPAVNGAGGTRSGQPSEGNPNPNTPINSTGGSTSITPVPTGTGGSATLPGTGGTTGAAAGGTNSTGGTGGTGAVSLPAPPGEAFFFDDFEAGAPGTQPAAWDSWINYSVEAGNEPTGQQFALLDNGERFSGNQSVHFHAEGATQPAMLTMALPANMTRIYIRAYVKTSKQIGNQVPDQQSNHETLMGLRATPNDGNFEIRFGGAKGALGYNIVGPGRNDAVAPGQSLWGSAPAITPNAWHCVELAFINDNPATPQATASVDGQPVRSVTGGEWHVPLSGEGTTWLNGMFREVILGWQSFSPAPGNDVWMDDVVMSQSPIGCD